MMEELIVDCRTGKKTRRKLTPEEAAVCEAAVASAATGEFLQQRKHEEVIERLRETQMGRDILALLGIGQ